MVVPLAQFEGSREVNGYAHVLKDGEPFASPFMVGIKNGHPYQWEWFGVFPIQGQLALALLLEVTSQRIAVALHQAFAWECVQHFDRDTWRVSTGVIAKWVSDYLLAAESAR